MFSPARRSILSEQHLLNEILNPDGTVGIFRCTMVPYFFIVKQGKISQNVVREMFDRGYLKL